MKHCELICDRCGKKIEEQYAEPQIMGKDLCGSCQKQLIKFIQGYAVG